MIIQTQKYVSVGKLHYEMVPMLCKAQNKTQNKSDFILRTTSDTGQVVRHQKGFWFVH